MKNDIYDYLEFKLGSESADYEFEMIPIPPYDFIEENLSLEPYEYFGDIQFILGLKFKQVLLYYNADVLMRVAVKFRGNKLQFIKHLLETSNIDFNNTNMFLKMYFSSESKETVVIYQHPIFNNKL